MAGLACLGWIASPFGGPSKSRQLRMGANQLKKAKPRLVSPGNVAPHPYVLASSADAMGLVPAVRQRSSFITNVAAAGKLAVTRARGDGFGSRSICLLLCNTTDDELVVTMPLGTMFSNGDDKAQPLVLARDFRLTLGPTGSAQVNLDGFCGDSNMLARPSDKLLCLSVHSKPCPAGRAVHVCVRTQRARARVPPHFTPSLLSIPSFSFPPCPPCPPCPLRFSLSPSLSLSSLLSLLRPYFASDTFLRVTTTASARRCLATLRHRGGALTHTAWGCCGSAGAVARRLLAPAAVGA